MTWIHHALLCTSFHSLLLMPCSLCPLYRVVLRFFSWCSRSAELCCVIAETAQPLFLSLQNFTQLPNGPIYRRHESDHSIHAVISLFIHLLLVCFFFCFFFNCLSFCLTVRFWKLCECCVVSRRLGAPSSLSDRLPHLRIVSFLDVEQAGAAHPHPHLLPQPTDIYTIAYTRSDRKEESQRGLGELESDQQEEKTERNETRRNAKGMRKRNGSEAE